MTQYKDKVFGVNIQTNKRVDIDNDFTLCEETDVTVVYVSNEIYHHNDDPNYDFNYQFVIEAYMDNGITVYSLFMVPTFDSMSEERKKDIVNMCGTDEPNILDVFYYGAMIMLHSEYTEEEYDKNVMDKIASMISMINSLRCFYLDKEQNSIGTTGWMILDYLLYDKDYIKATNEKLKEYEEYEYQ